MGAENSAFKMEEEPTSSKRPITKKCLKLAGGIDLIREEGLKKADRSGICDH